jgi:hypothetical protein
VLNFRQSVMIAGKIRFSFFTFLALFHSKTVRIMLCFPGLNSCTLNSEKEWIVTS